MEYPVTVNTSVSWCENREGELFLLYAEKTPLGWVIYERSTFEVRYFRVPATQRRVAAAEAELRKRQAGEVAS